MMTTSDGRRAAALTIRSSAGRSSPGDLHARVENQNVYLPDPVAKAFQQEGVRTAADLLSYMHAFPSAVADILHWQPQEVAQATSRLERQLLGRVDNSVLGPGTRSNPPLGAFDPDDLP